MRSTFFTLTAISVAFLACGVHLTEARPVSGTAPILPRDDTLMAAVMPQAGRVTKHTAVTFAPVPPTLFITPYLLLAALA
ncbi:hypothetical protein BU17DRAFT_97980 [Hysterangium stoloniferum]|nr:hypothetical protein BU17DRAFT_97980 [Hysterangium stoloniferum]